MEKFIEQFAEAIERNSVDVGKEDKFREYEEWDSLAVLSIIAMIKKHYGITIPRQEFDNLITIDDLHRRVTGA